MVNQEQGGIFLFFVTVISTYPKKYGTRQVKHQVPASESVISTMHPAPRGTCYMRVASNKLYWKEDAVHHRDATNHFFPNITRSDGDAACCGGTERRNQRSEAEALRSATELSNHATLVDTRITEGLAGNIKTEEEFISLQSVW